MGYDRGEGEQVGFNLLAQRTQQLSDLGRRAFNAFLAGKIDDYFYSLICLRQNLTPNLRTNERRVLNKIEKDIHELKFLANKELARSSVDKPGQSIVSGFSKFAKPNSRSALMSKYVERIKKFEQALLIVMKKKGFYPGKTDASTVT